MTSDQFGSPWRKLGAVLRLVWAASPGGLVVAILLTLAIVLAVEAAGQNSRIDRLRGSGVPVSVRVTRNALAMLAANRYVSRPGSFRSYSIIWQAGA